MILDNIYSVVGTEVYFIHDGWIGQGEVVGVYKTLYSVVVELRREKDETRYVVDASMVFDTLEQVASPMACIGEARMFTGE
ncbi:MAG: hypothetical protein SVY53_05255 [Chloroflexota bacterium]|nr:hypothetical protein [Chloroflexota bacterium]